MESLCRLVDKCTSWTDTVSCMSCRWRSCPCGSCSLDVQFYPDVYEYKGGAKDGKRVWDHFATFATSGILDECRVLFSGAGDTKGTIMFIGNSRKGQVVCIQILARPPKDADPVDWIGTTERKERNG